MTTLRVWLSRALDLVLRRQRDDRLSEEIASHLDLLETEYIARGLSQEDARRAARRDFGGVEPIKEAYRDQRGVPVADSLLQDLKFACRLLWRDPAFTASAVAVLALGIGVNTMLFTVVNAHTIRGLPIRDAERVVYLTTMNDRLADLGVSFRDFVDWQTRSRSFDAMAAFTSRPIVVTGDGHAPETISGTYTSHTAFRLVGTQPLLGRDFTPADDVTGAPAVVLLGAATWESRYSRDPGVVNRAVTVNGMPATIIGVVPERSGFPSSGKMFLPLAMIPDLAEQSRDVRSLGVIARLRDGVEVAQARADVESIAAQLTSEYPPTNAKLRARAVPINEQYQGSLRHPAWRSFIAVGILVVLISCANAANLMLSRSLNRCREIAIRTSLGASRLRVVRQLCVEGAALAAVAGALGLVVATVGVTLFGLAVPAGALPYWVHYTIDARVITSLVFVSAATVLLFALLPAVQGSKANPTLVLKEGGRLGAVARGRRWTTAFLAAEFGLAVVLLASFVANVRGMQPVVASDTVLQTSQVLTAEIALPEARYGSPERRAQFYTALAERLHGVSTIEASSLATKLPLNGGEPRVLEIDGRTTRGQQEPETVVTVAVAPGYFATIGLPLIRGREFTGGDTVGPSSAIVNERFVERYYAGGDPIGQRIAVSPKPSTAPPAWMTITAVAPSIRQRATANAEPVVYVPLLSFPSANANAALLVKSTQPTQAAVDALRDELRALDPNLPLNQTRTLRQAVRDAEWVGRTSRNLSNTLTLIAVMLAAFGLYAVTSYAVSQRTQEIGLRMALGAGRWQVAFFIGRNVAKQVVIGLLTGIVCTRIWGWLFSTGRRGITASDLIPFASVIAIVAVIAVVASFVPVRRATRLDPVAALRQE